MGSLKAAEATAPARSHDGAPWSANGNAISRIFYLPMEIASRELDSRLLIAAFALQRGYEIVLGQKWLIERNINAMQPGIYLSKTLTKRDAKYLARAHDRGYFVASIDEEMPGLVVDKDDLRWVSEAALALSNLVFVPGSGNAAALQAKFPAHASKVRAVGNPRFDLLRRALRSLYRDEVAALNARYGRFILVNTNLGLTNSEKGAVKSIISEQVRLGKLSLDNPGDVAYVESIEAMENANRAEIEALLRQLPAAAPNHRIILRPHPSEDLKLWHDIIGASPQIEIVREGPVAPWILASDVIVHTNCTTGVEAVALDRPAICIVPSDTQANARYLSNKVNPVVRTATEAIRVATEALAAPEQFRYSADMLARFHESLSFDDDRLAAAALVDEIEGRLAQARGAEPQWRPGWKYRWHQADKNVRGKLMPSLDLDLVVDHLTKLRDLLGLRFDIVAEPCGSKLVHLSSRGLAPSVRWRRRLSSLFAPSQPARPNAGSA